ncbi:MAG: glycine betaine/L-proline ABC transporter substrate-binding protein ProX [Actinomycetia bacterium]|nr:glycine betaine/L-proline ABC transporter substrate-binding protein ProX [Actinomycetes bacterium]
MAGPIAVLLVVLTGLSRPAEAVDPQETPGGGETVRLARPTWDTGWFQAEVVSQLLEELGYRVDGPTTMENESFYRAVDRGEVDLWVNGWFPLHDGLLDQAPGATALGFEVRGGALQGYLADRETVEALGIETLADLADPRIASAFDSSGDGKADLIGCNPDWSCGPIVDHHLEAYGLSDTVTQVQGDYGPLMRATVERHQAGESILFYTFTPNWTVGQLVLGHDVVWVPAPFPSLPAGITDQEPLTVVAGIDGCLADPCSMGFAPNDIRAVASTDFLTANPAVKALLNRLEIPLDDISDQNATMMRGEDAASDIATHARQWIDDNRQLINNWLDEAVVAHTTAGLVLAPGPTPSADGSTSPDGDTIDRVGPVRVVTRLAPPFVTYDEGRYGGFSIELLRLVADDVGAEVDLYAVNSTAKLIDDVARDQADIGIGAVAITSRREQSVDFTQPYIDSGLQILVADRDEGAFGGRLGAVARAIFSPGLLILILVLMVALVVAAHAIWLTERKTNPDFPESYRSGIWESLWWASVTATTVGYGDKTPKGTLGRVFGLLWMFSGLFVLAYFTAGITTSFAIDELSRAIDGPADLRGHAVGATADSAAIEFLQLQGIGATEYPTADEAYDALLTGDLDAVVHDAAILQHFVATDGRGGADVSGLVFAERGFGLAVPTDSDLTETLNRALLRVVESGEYKALHDRWFGAAPAGS